MAGYDDEARPSDAEVYIVDDDDPPEAGYGRPTGRPTDRPPRAAGRRLGAVLGAVAVFALGVVLGRTSLGVQGAATAPHTPSSSAVTTGGITTTALPDTSPPTASPPPAAPRTAAPRAAPLTSLGAFPAQDANGHDRWPTVSGACGRDMPQPLIENAHPLEADVAVHLVAGGDPAPVSLGNGTVGARLFEPDAGQSVTDVAADADGAVLLLTPCSARGPGRVVRVAPGGNVTDIPLPDGTLRAQLIPGGDRIWVAASPGSYGFNPVTLIAADGSGDAATLPRGLEPLAGHGGRIVAAYGGSGMPNGLLAIIDPATGGIVKRFGTTDSEGMLAIAGGDYVIAAPWVCGDACSIRRYRIDTGEQATVPLSPASDAILSGGGVISPDGRFAAIPLYGQAASPAPFQPYRLGAAGDDRFTRVGLVNLRDGTVLALPGLTLGATTPPALAISPDGRWIVVAVGAGYKTRLLLYTADGDGPFDPHIDIPGLVASPPLAVAPLPSK